MNEKIKKIFAFIRRNAILFTLGLSIIAAALSIVNYFVNNDLHISQLAIAQERTEEELKNNIAQHDKFITKEEFNVRIDAIQAIVTQSNETIKIINKNINQILIR